MLYNYTKLYYILYTIYLYNIGLLYFSLYCIILYYRPVISRLNAKGYVLITYKKFITTQILYLQINLCNFKTLCLLTLVTSSKNFQVLNWTLAISLY